MQVIHPIKYRKLVLSVLNNFLKQMGIINKDIGFVLFNVVRTKIRLSKCLWNGRKKEINNIEL